MGGHLNETSKILIGLNMVSVWGIFSHAEESRSGNRSPRISGKPFSTEMSGESSEISTLDSGGSCH